MNDDGRDQHTVEGEMDQSTVLVSEAAEEHIQARVVDARFCRVLGGGGRGLGGDFQLIPETKHYIFSNLST